MESGQAKLLTEQVLEIRYKPEARVLDHRGNWTRNLASLLHFERWQISENRIDVFQTDESERVFISFRNAGGTVRNKDQSSFIKFTQTFLTFLFDQSLFRNPQIERIGVLGKFAKEYDGSFNELLHLYKDRYYSIQPAVQEIFDAQLIDVGANLNFKTDRGFINSLAGPMEEKQLKEFFTFEKELPKVAAFISIDSFFTPDISKTLSNKQAINLVQEYIKGNWARFEKLLEILNK